MLPHIRVWLVFLAYITCSAPAVLLLENEFPWRGLVYTINSEQDDHLLALTARLGPLPDELYRHWKTSSHYFTPERKLFNCQIGGAQEGEAPVMLEQTSMEELFNQAGPDLSEDESQAVKALIRWILQYDPAKRPSPAAILLNPWFSKGVAGSSSN